MQGIQFIGTQRSGSNLLRLMLNQLSVISAPHPPHILRTFIPLISKYGSLKSPDALTSLIDDVLDWVKANPVEWTNWDIHRDDIISNLRDHSVEAVFESIYRLKARQDQAEIWCCKSLANVQYVDRLEAKGIHPLYLHLVRDGRDVACSFQKAIVGPKHIYHLAKKWSNEQALAFEVGIKYPERYILVKYEDLIEDPAKQVQRICAAAGIDYSDQVLDYYKSIESEHTAKSGEMWKNVVSPVISDNRFKYRNKLSREEISLFNQIAEKQLNQLGYDIDTDSQKIEINDSLINQFNAENDALIAQVKHTASAVDIALRQPQEVLLKRIVSKTLSVEL